MNHTGTGKSSMHQDSHAASQRTRMQRIMLLAGSSLMAGVCVYGLLWQLQFIWVICPQALIVMFLRQALSPFDSLGAAHYPDLAVGALYYPLVGQHLARALRNGVFTKAAIRVVVAHALAFAAALAAVEIRNNFWFT